MAIFSRLLAATALLLLTFQPCSAVNEDGEWGVPENTFTIPVNNPNHGLYLKDIQGSYPNVDWSNLDRLYIPAGQYKFIKIGNLPDRTPDRPLIITNSNGQVRVGGLDMYYLVSIVGGSNWILTGKYDPVSLTGHAEYPGHRGGNYDNTKGTYGILVDDDYRTFGTGNSGIAIGDRNEPTSDFEVSFVEIREVGFAGMAIKCDNTPTFVMNNVFIHDNYIHDMGSEGIYLGSTAGYAAQHSFENLRISNNRILRVGTEGIQAGQLGDGCEIHNNVVALSALDWKDAFQIYQDNSAQIHFRYGQASVHHNIFIGAASSLINFQACNADGDVHIAGDSMTIHDNFLSSSRWLGIYMGQTDQPKTSNVQADGVTTYKVLNNTFRQVDFQRDEINRDSPTPELLRVNMHLTNDIIMNGNVLDSPSFVDGLKLTKFPYCQWIETNGESCSISAADNVRETVAPVQFHNFLPGIPAEVDYLTVERWAAMASLNNGGAIPINYLAGDYVTHFGEIYQANEANTGVSPSEDTTGTWTLLPSPVDDVRLACDSAHQGVGLLDALDACTPTCTREFEDPIESGLGCCEGLEACALDGGSLCVFDCADLQAEECTAELGDTVATGLPCCDGLNECVINAGALKLCVDTCALA